MAEKLALWSIATDSERSHEQAGCSGAAPGFFLWHLLEFAQHHMDVAIPADRDVVDQAAHIHISELQTTAISCPWPPPQAPIRCDI